LAVEDPPAHIASTRDEPGTGWSDGLLEGGFGDPRMAEVLGWPGRVRRMVEVEAALGRALQRVGVIPAAAAEAITAACDPARLDLVALAAEAGSAPTPVIPLLRAIDTAAGGACRSLHHGATSQDVIDTAAVLQVREALHLLEEELVAAADRCAELAAAHRGTVLAGRTLGQQAVPVTFGLKAARWLGALDRRVQQLRWARPRVLGVQLGGAAGTLGAYGADGLAVAEALADELALSLPDLPWHAERDRVVELAGILTGVVTTVAKVATDLVLLAQTEVGEVREVGDGPGSSAMPHKHNPVHATAARAASRLALGELSVLVGAAGDHEHERAAGAWQAEWVAVPSALVRTGGAVRRLRAALDVLEVDGDRGRRNLLAGLGLTGSEALATALSPALGRTEAQALTGRLVTRAAMERRQLREVALEDARVTSLLGVQGVEAALDVSASLRLVGSLIDRAIATHRRTVGMHPAPG
jgi:3-carboxy-cis,cis-muconate cycloisomerase